MKERKKMKFGVNEETQMVRSFYRETENIVHKTLPNSVKTWLTQINLFSIFYFQPNLTAAN